MRLRGVVMVLLLLPMAEAMAMRCGNRVVTTGDRDFQVRERCGEPFYVGSYSELEVRGQYGPLEQRVERVFEEWYYNFGPRSLVRRLLFADGRLVRLDTAGYGSRSVGDDCGDAALRPGLTPGEVFLRCGAPEGRSQRYEDTVVRDGAGNALVRPVRREEWRYRLRGSRFMRLAVFVDGRLQQVDRVPL